MRLDNLVKLQRSFKRDIRVPAIENCTSCVYLKVRVRKRKENFRIKIPSIRAVQVPNADANSPRALLQSGGRCRELAS